MGDVWLKAANPLTPTEYAAFYEMVKPIVEAQNGRVTLEEIVGDHHQGKNDVWYTVAANRIQSLCITRVREHRSGLRIMQIQFGAGRMGDFYDYMHEAIAVARENGCHRLQVSGRSGWKRALAGMGDDSWTEISRTIEKEI